MRHSWIWCPDLSAEGVSPRTNLRSFQGLQIPDLAPDNLLLDLLAFTDAKKSSPAPWRLHPRAPEWILWGL